MKVYLGWIGTQTLVQAFGLFWRSDHLVQVALIPAYGPESIHYGTLRSACGHVGFGSISASTGWAHAYQEGADCILRALHAAAQLKVLSAHDLGKVRASGI